jgi:hypothetical protein
LYGSVRGLVATGNIGSCLAYSTAYYPNDSVVIMSLEEFEALEETAYLLRSPKNTRRLIESIAQLEKGKGTERELIE